MRLHSERRLAEPGKAEVTALLGAFCFFLSAVEYMLPKPMPFMRLGIANLPILLAVDLLPFPWFLTLAVVKVIGMSVISGSLFSFIALFSLAGTLTAALMMWVARKAGGRFITQIGVSIVGAIASNAVQMVLARYVVFGQAAWLIAPLFLAMGLATGTALGIFAGHFARVSRWYAAAAGLAERGESDGGANDAPSPDAAGARTAGEAKARSKAAAEAGAARAARRQRFEALFAPWSLALAGALAAFVFLFETTPLVKAVFLIFFVGAAYLSGKRFSLITTLIVSTGIIAANLLVPSGKVLVRIGPLAITQFALFDGIMKALTFEGLMFLSKATIMQGLRLPGRLGSIVATAFVYYDRIVEYKGKVRAATLSSDADAMMLSIWESESRSRAGSEPGARAEGPSFTPPPNSRSGYLILAITLVFLISIGSIF